MYRLSAKGRDIIHAGGVDNYNTIQDSKTKPVTHISQQITDSTLIDSNLAGGDQQNNLKRDKPNGTFMQIFIGVFIAVLAAYIIYKFGISK